MCEPTTIALVTGLVLAAAGTAYSVDANNKATDAQNEQAEENAKAANAQAKNVEQAGYVQEDQVRARTRAMLASQKVGFAANGVDMSTGSALDILGDTAVAGEQDALTVRANAAAQAWGLRSQAVGYANDASMATAANNNANTGTILTTASSMAGQYGSYSKGRTAKTTTG